MKSAKYFILNRLSGSLGRGILSIVLTQRLKRLLSRPVRFKLESSFSSNPNEMTPEEAVIISRLINFWNASQEFNSSTSSENSPWHDIERAQTKLSELMREGDSERIFQYLISAPSHAICNGVLQGDSETRMLRSNRRYRNLHSRITLNRFVNLLEGIGNGYLVQNPEQGIWGYGKDFDFNSALTQLDELKAEAAARRQEAAARHEALETARDEARSERATLQAQYAGCQAERTHVDEAMAMASQQAAKDQAALKEQLAALDARCLASVAEARKAQAAVESRLEEVGS